MSWEILFFRSNNPNTGGICFVAPQFSSTGFAVLCHTGKARECMHHTNEHEAHVPFLPTETKMRPRPPYTPTEPGLDIRVPLNAQLPVGCTLALRARPAVAGLPAATDGRIEHRHWQHVESLRSERRRARRRVTNAPGSGIASATSQIAVRLPCGDLRAGGSRHTVRRRV